MNYILNRGVVGTALVAAALSGCGGSSNNSNSPSGELVEVGENQVALYFNLQDSSASYEDWGLHIWNGGSCPEGYSQAMIDRAGEHFENWADPYPFEDESDTYGVYWILDINPDAECANFIIHKGDEKGMGSADGLLEIAKADDYAFTFKDVSTVFYDAIETPPVAIEGAAAHLTNAESVRWNVPDSATSIMLLSSAAANIALNADGSLAGDYITIDLSSASATDNAPPHLSGFGAFTHEASADELKAALKTQLVAVAMNNDEQVVAATNVQIPLALDALYTAGDNDADEADLGVSVVGSSTDFSVWAPTATQVELLAFDANTKVQLAESPIAMTEDPATGIWSASTSLAEGTYYQYRVAVYHPATGRNESLVTTDPYSISLSMNSVYSQVVDLDSAALKPAGWDDHVVPVTEPKNIVIYESHIRDFSISDPTTTEAYRGTYKAFTETESEAMKHVLALQEAGLTHFHLLPAADFATTNEDPTQRIEITNTVGELCAIRSTASVCGEDAGATLLSLLEQCDPATQCAETIIDDIRDLDGFNWGYDPLHFGVPEGTYSTNADGTTRIVEFREMVQTLHENGLNVVMDLVYNHTNASGVGDKSVLDKVVPGYYHRLDELSGAVTKSTCCDNTATEHAMMAKLMTDTILIWTEHYKVDAYRFDLMGHQPKQAMIDSLAAAREINENVYFYGEGWNFGEVVNDARFVQARQHNMYGTGIGTFSDRGRDAIRGGGPFDGGDAIRTNQGLGNGLYTLPNENNSGSQDELTNWLKQADIVRVELTGNLADFILIDRNGDTKRGKDVDYNGQESGYAAATYETQTYVSKHDNQTLWDNNQYKLPAGLSAMDRARMQVLTYSFPLLGQSIPFMHMGVELLRSKSMERDSYDSGDWYNKVDFSAVDNNWNKGLPRDDKDGSNYELIGEIIADTSIETGAAELEHSRDMFMEYLKIRSSSPLFGLGEASVVMKRVDYHNTGTEQTPGLIVQSIDDGVNAGADLDSNYDAIMVIYNMDADSHSVAVPANAELHPVQQNSVDAAIAAVEVSSGSVDVPAFSTIVIVVPQDGAQGAGIPVSAKDMNNIAPFGDTKVYIRGSMNDWGTANETLFVGEGVYSTNISLDAGSYEFKFADADWADVNYGFGGITEGADSLALSDAGGNISVTIETAGIYKFDVDANNTDQLVVTVSASEDTPTFGDTGVYLRGSFDPGWAALEDYQFTYVGGGIYELNAALSAGGVNFKIADDSWGDINFGQDGGVVALDTEIPLEYNKGDLSFDAPTDGTYTLVFDAVNLTLTVTQ
ncbi:pullulanase-type alpha-1,6-glucosidase [Neiella sp. HB171785]|uniref:Pullulanase-type alpha-1,6-glucosidase n=1 Tax=Neiella litorisoli TaxID=2771431 RepID=A0A8J6QQ76_9GAMM|nr:pullulanase-type alpha-1,6-glucosidase [Neiella litorisoli]MBD1388504.1 pullulanase-type alpha-1,6-glucosidase [Neiella litorisoli]